MPPSTFASAAANGPNSASARDAGSEWGRKPNGATQTFRRPSGAATMSSSPAPAQSDALPPSNPAPRYVPPHRNSTISEMRYSKDQLLDLFRAQQGVEGGLHDGLSGMLAASWQPEGANGAGWGRGEHARETQTGPDICWERDGQAEPLGLVEMDDEERERFSTTVNTSLTRQSGATKDGGQTNGAPGRKTSISATTPGGFGQPSPSVTRGFGRHRGPSESHGYGFPQTGQQSPAVGRDDQRAPSPPPSLQRRRTDLKDSENDAEDKAAATPYNTLRRNQTGSLSAGLGAPSSPWSTGPQSAGLSPMGSFGNFGLGSQQAPSSDKRPGLGSGRLESRFKNLLNKDSSEDVSSPTVQRKSSMSSLSRVNENESWRPQEDAPAPLPEADEELPTGSAALAAGSDLSPPQTRTGARGFGTPSRSNTTDDLGFGAFGMTSDNALGGGQGFLQGRDAFHQTPSAQRSGQQLGGHEPMSPTDTNPYKSPEQHGLDRMGEERGAEGQDLLNSQLPGLGAFGGPDQGHQMGGLSVLGGFGNLGRGLAVPAPASDRSQTSSTAGNRGFAGLGGLGQFGGPAASSGWPASQPGFGAQATGLSNAFGGGIFATSAAEMQSPGLAGLGGAGFMNPPSAGGLGGGGRMGSMFPPAMQEQMRQNDLRGDSDVGLPQGFGGLSDAQSPFISQPAGESSQFGPPGQQFGQVGEQQRTAEDSSAPQAAAPQPASSASNQPPAPQQRTMVMPDRMRWIYRDPQGQTQGPWTGLEMHDWYKAGFFSPELLVKKFEDTEYEPLAQLIRRIGNSREPFLVPQIGIPHGPPSNNGPTAWASTGTAMPASNPTSAGGVQPPFASSFPSFGTTLTADQQNALERRKQEEQYLMARQKEHLAQAQMAQRMSMQGAGGQHGLAPGSVKGAGPSQLHHHSSAQSLHSQPSFGSMTSPNQFQPSPQQAPAAGSIPGFFDNSFRSPQSAALGAVGAGVDSLGHIREEEIPGIVDRLNAGERAGAGQFGAPGQPFAGQQQAQHQQQVQQMLQDRARLQQEQAQHDAHHLQQAEERPAQNGRLQQFQQLQAQGLDARFQAALADSMSEQPSSTAQSSAASPPTAPQPLSLTEQVEAAVSAQQSPTQAQGLPQPFPPAPSQSPLPAPAAQRTGRQSVADQLQTESRDLSQTPSVETPSAAVAPWAKEPSEAPKGPSLKEIQELEAKKAAEAEALAAAARRAAAEKEMEALAAAQQVAQPALPAGASWAAPQSPAAPGSAATPAAWAKAAQKTTGASAKSMAQIQKEEEARKKRLAAQAASAQAAAMQSVPSPAGGKSYANLAGKVGASPAPTASGAWTTVGAGGKTKTPAATPAANAPARTHSSGVVPGAQPVAAVRKAPSRSSTMGGAGQVNAQEEFRKWAVAELRPDLDKNPSPEDFVATLYELGTDRDMITEVVHQVSKTIDSRHFAEEFLRRKKLADKGLVDTSAPTKTASPAGGASGGQGGGWSEVAKKGPVKEAPLPLGREESNGAFRVVPSKKKGGKR